MTKRKQVRPDTTPTRFKFPEDIYPDKQHDEDDDLYCGHFQIIDTPPVKFIDYKFNEKNLLDELGQYIDDTYEQHYSGDTYQATDIIIDAGHGIGFTLGNVIKYAKRYGKKEGFNRKDLLKMIHYSFLALYVHDLNEERAQEIDES